jgi:FKBP-type peptidyl-prolyl cis-trans isomerase 2
MAEPGPSRLLLVVAIVVTVAAAGVAAWAVNYVLEPRGSTGLLTVAAGDNVTVNYTGSFASGPQAGRVFDTSIYSVYLNNVSYPKSLEFPFTHGGSPTNYTPLAVHVGPSGSYTIGNLSFGPTVTGFWQGLVGMTGNSTRILVLPPALAYGPLNPACLQTRPLAFTVPTTVSVPASQFATLYPGVSATVGTTFPDPTYRWSDQVLSVNSSSVVVQRLPSMGQTTLSGGWNITVTGLNASTVSVLNDLTPSNYGGVLGTFSSAQTCGGSTASHYLVSAVDPAAGTYTINWNSEVTGQTLEFRVTVIDIFPG